MELGPLVSGCRALGVPDLVPVLDVRPDPGVSVGGAISRVSCEFGDFRAACLLMDRDMCPGSGALLHCPSSEARRCRPPSPPPKGILSGSCALAFRGNHFFHNLIQILYSNTFESKIMLFFTI